MTILNGSKWTTSGRLGPLEMEPNTEQSAIKGANTKRVNYEIYVQIT